MNLIWISRIAFLFGGFVVAAVFFILYFIVAGFFTVFLLGIENEAFHQVQYGVCWIAGVVTSLLLLRRGWPRQSKSD